LHVRYKYLTTAVSPLPLQSTALGELLRMTTLKQIIQKSAYTPNNV